VTIPHEFEVTGRQIGAYLDGHLIDDHRPIAVRKGRCWGTGRSWVGGSQRR
jgi:hypothetical protein